MQSHTFSGCSPMMQSMMDNPEMLRTMMTSNPMIQQVRARAERSHSCVGGLACLHWHAHGGALSSALLLRLSNTTVSCAHMHPCVHTHYKKQCTQSNTCTRARVRTHTHTHTHTQLIERNPELGSLPLELILCACKHCKPTHTHTHTHTHTRTMQLIERNPELGSLLNDPSLLRQSLQIASNPVGGGPHCVCVCHTNVCVYVCTSQIQIRTVFADCSKPGR